MKRLIIFTMLLAACEPATVSDAVPNVDPEAEATAMAIEHAIAIRNLRAEAPLVAVVTTDPSLTNALKRRGLVVRTESAETCEPGEVVEMDDGPVQLSRCIMIEGLIELSASVEARGDDGWWVKVVERTSVGGVDSYSHWSTYALLVERRDGEFDATLDPNWGTET